MLKKDARGMPIWEPPRPDGSTRPDPSAAKALAAAREADRVARQRQMATEQAVLDRERREAQLRQQADLRVAIGWSALEDELSVLRSEVAHLKAEVGRLGDLIDPSQLQDPQDAPPRRRRFGRS